MKFSILAQTSHKICFFLMILFLSGCVGYTPTYYSDNIEFIIYGLQANDKDEIHVYVDNQETELEKEKISQNNYPNHKHNVSSKTIYGGKEILYCSSEEYKTSENESFYNISFKIKREYKNKTIKVTRTGKPDKTINLYYQITDEKWASGKAEISRKADTTAAILLLPTNTYETLSICGQAFGNVFKGDPHTGGIVISCLAFIPMAIGVDIYNVVIGLPSTVIINPWTNYQIQQNDENCL